MAIPLDSSSGLWTFLGQASNVVQLVGVDALGLVSMVVQAALVARRHRDACQRLAQHVEIVGGLLRELELAELMQREATRRPLEQLRGALRRCYKLVAACQDCGYLRGLLVGARMAEELRAAEQEIDMFIRLIPLIALVDTAHDRRIMAPEGVPVLTTNGSSHHARCVKSFTEVHAGGAAKICSVEKQPLADKVKGPLLDWPKRVNIIKGLAEGLVYMQKHSMLWIVHRDLKPHNVLLDHDLNPKISDFGSAITLSSDAAEGRTSRVVGTCGYKAPEYASRGIYSVKTDVFSFGVLALVIISGRNNSILEHQGDKVGNLARDAWKLWNDGRLHELVDPALSDRFELAEIMHFTQVALLCAQEDPADRPTMSEVITLLNFENIILLPDPKQASGLVNGGSTGDKLSTYMSQSSRTIDITVTCSALVSTRVHIIVEPDI